MKLPRVAILCMALLLVSGSVSLAKGFGHRGGFGPGGLLMIPEVQRELKLEQSQLDRLRQLGEEMRVKAQETFRGVQNLPREERDRRFFAFHSEWNRAIDEILDDRQEERLKQLHLQREGVRALYRKDVADKLRLSSDQRQRIGTILEGEREEMRKAFEGFNGTMTPDQREEIGRRFREVKEQTDARLTAVLTDSQKRHWQSMQGAPFRFPEFRRGRRRN